MTERQQPPRCPECGRFIRRRVPWSGLGYYTPDMAFMCTNQACGFGTEETEYR